MSETIGYLTAIAAFIASWVLLLSHILDLGAEIKSTKSRVDALENRENGLSIQIESLTRIVAKQAERIENLTKITLE